MRNSNTPPASNADGPTRLKGGQRRICDAYLDNDNGLHVLSSNPGAGKSTALTDIGAKELLRRFVDGDTTPEQHLCVVCFTRDDASSFVQQITDRLRELVEHDLTPAAAAVSNDDVEYLVDRIKRAPLFGTIDGVFRGILSDIVADVGFAEMPAVGNDAQLTRLHADCYERLASDPAYASAIDVVETAYPDDDYVDGPADLLQQALQHCRSRRLTTDEFIDELHATVDAVYVEGETTSFDDIAAALARCIGPDIASEARRSLDDADREELVDADQQLHTAWREAIDALGTLLDAYRDEYDALTRERGVISHGDCAYLVAEFLAGNLGTSDAAARKRDRVLARYRTRIESVLIDEAQDVSELQHAALSQIVTADCRVLAAGDLRQSIYVWRNAHPTIFERAVDQGRYLGIDWDTHVTETAATTYRCTPDIAAAINAIAEPIFTDPTRGNLGDLDVTYPALDPDRPAADTTNVHVAAFETNATPGSRSYVDPDRGHGEAGILATYIARGIADGTFQPTNHDTDTPETPGDDPDVTVLFRWRTHMDRYRDAFEAQGLTVADTSEYLFDCPAVRAAVDVAEWLVNPADTERLQTLITESSLGLSDLTATFRSHDWQLEAVRHADTNAVTDDQRDILDGLQQLTERRAAFRAQPPAATLADIVDTLALRADPHDIATTVETPQRVANLDAVIDLVNEWRTESEPGLEDLVTMLTPFRDDPYTGPTQPDVHAGNHDVVFKTIHQAKGDESDVIAIADLGWPLRKHGPVDQRFVDADTLAALAPPTYASTSSAESLSVFNGLYDPDGGAGRFTTPGPPLNIGLRWATEHWTDTAPFDTDSDPALVGHDHLQTATRLTRAEAYRILFVALSRARDHLVVPLPRNIQGPERPRDRWLEPIRDALQFDGTPRSGTYSINVDDPDGTTRSIDVAVNDVDPITDQPDNNDSPPSTPYVGATPPDETNLSTLVPRIIRPSTLLPLSEDMGGNIIDHLQNQPLHTDSEAIDDDLPLTLEAFDTDDVGTFIHSVLTRCIEQDLPTESLQTRDGAIDDIIQAELHRHGPPASQAERSGLVTFLTEDVLPAVADSTLWTQVKQATDVYVEKPLAGTMRRGDVDFEIDGQADVVLRNPDDSWTITDTKIALTDTSPETRRRYEVQVACYAWLLAQETDIDDPSEITRAVETFGAVTQRHVDTTDPSTVLDRLDGFLERGSVEISPDDGTHPSSIPE